MKKPLVLLAVAVFAMVAIAVGSIPAFADDSDREIPTIGMSSPSSGEIHVIWATPSDTDSLSSYRVSWGLWVNGLTSYRDANSDTGGNAYPNASASSYTITGLAPGEYAVFVRARYDDYGNGAFKKSARVVVVAAGSRRLPRRLSPPRNPHLRRHRNPRPSPRPNRLCSRAKSRG